MTRSITSVRAAVAVLNGFMMTAVAVLAIRSWMAGGASTGEIAAALGLGLLVARHKTWLSLFSGTLAGAIVFYLATNTASWAGDVAYAKTAADGGRR